MFFSFSFSFAYSYHKEIQKETYMAIHWKITIGTKKRGEREHINIKIFFLAKFDQRRKNLNFLLLKKRISKSILAEILPWSLNLWLLIQIDVPTFGYQHLLVATHPKWFCPRPLVSDPHVPPSKTV